MLLFLVFFLFPKSNLYLRLVLLYTYQERQRVWPCEALATCFGLMEQGANSYSGFCSGKDKPVVSNSNISLICEARLLIWWAFFLPFVPGVLHESKAKMNFIL
jgi:hypothetical protein